MPTGSQCAACGALLALAFAAATACSSSSNDHPPAISSGGDTALGSDNGGAGNSGTKGSSAGQTSGGANAQAGATPGEAGAGPIFESDAGPGRPPPGDPKCNELASWSGAMALDTVSTAADETLLSITSDELDLAFLRDGALYVAHREDASGTFVVGDAVSIPSGWSADEGVALSADGKRLVFVSSDQTMLGETTRTARDAAFTGHVDQTNFSLLNQASSYSGNIFAAPALSPDDQELFLSSTAPSGGSTVVVATRATDQTWTSPLRLSEALDGAAGMRRLPTGVSADARTLFYFNEATMKEEARWRDTAMLVSPLYDMVDLGTRRGAQPNSACDKLYSEAAGDLVVEHD
jgi:hypothetical protein